MSFAWARQRQVVDPVEPAVADRFPQRAATTQHAPYLPTRWAGQATAMDEGEKT